LKGEINNLTKDLEESMEVAIRKDEQLLNLKSDL